MQKFSQVDSRVLPASDPAYQASAFIEDNFPGQESNPIEIIFPNGVGKESAISEYAAKLSALTESCEWELQKQSVQMSD